MSNKYIKDMSSNFNPDQELTWYNEGGDFKSGGYSVDSLFKTLGISPIMSGGGGDGNGQKGGGLGLNKATKVSQLFKTNSVPAGLTLLNGGNMKGGEVKYDLTYSGGGLIKESLFDKLTKMASPDYDIETDKPTSQTKSKKIRITKKKNLKNKANSLSKNKTKLRKTRKTKQ